MKRTFGTGDDSIVTNKKNAFRYPKDPEAIFPQHPDPVFIDRRTAAIPAELLIQEKGIKKKNLKKQMLKENRDRTFKQLKDKVDGNEREGEIIDINNIDMDYELEKLTLDNEKNKNKKAKKQTKKMDMDLDVEESKPKNTRRTNRKNKKSKSYYLINY
jgi:hypothetical protein